jgi:hypothetical protein
VAFDRGCFLLLSRILSHPDILSERKPYYIGLWQRRRYQPLGLPADSPLNLELRRYSARFAGAFIIWILILLLVNVLLSGTGQLYLRGLWLMLFAPLIFMAGVYLYQKYTVPQAVSPWMGLWFVLKQSTSSYPTLVFILVSIFTTGILSPAFLYPFPLAIGDPGTLISVETGPAPRFEMLTHEKLVLETKSGDDRAKYVEELKTRRLAEHQAKINQMKTQRIEQSVQERPFNWVLLCGGTVPMRWMIVSLVCSLVIPLWLFGMTGSVLVGGVAHASYMALVAVDNEKYQQAAGWESTTRLLSDRAELSARPFVRIDSLNGAPVYLATDELLADPHFLLGYDPLNGLPVLLAESILRQHAHLMGESGTGKTAMGLAPIIDQILQKKNAGVVVLDLKGDRSLFNSVKVSADSTGHKFRWFSPVKGQSSYAFNPFAQTMNRHFTPQQLADSMVIALGADHGDGYGRSYFTGTARVWMKRMFEIFENIRSFSELGELIKDPTTHDGLNRDHSRELANAVEMISGHDELNCTDRALAVEEGIQIERIIEEQEVAYFSLPYSATAKAGGQIARLVADQLFRGIAAYNSGASSGTRTVYLIIDEFQMAVNLSFSAILEQARSLGMPVVLSHQNISQLKKQDGVNLTEVVNNAAFRQYFSADGESLEYVMRQAGDAVEYHETFGSFSGPQGGGTSSQVRRERVYRYDRNQIIQMSNQQDLSMVRMMRSAGYSQYQGFPVIIQGLYHIPKNEYERRMALTWPNNVPGQTIPDDEKNQSESEPEGQENKERTEKSESESFDERMRRLADDHEADD